MVRNHFGLRLFRHHFVGGNRHVACGIGDVARPRRPGWSRRHRPAGRPDSTPARFDVHEWPSVSTVATISPRSTRSPGCFSQVTTTPSVMVSESCGIVIA
jgi:hypothetical protein